MSNSVFQINKGINRPIEFHGLKAQYIMYFVAGVLALLVLFAIMYIIGINSYICVASILALGTAITLQLYAMSNKYGEHGLSKKMATRSIPKVISNHSRRVFMLNQSIN
jgi:4-hydroxybenzoate polyprenyltransferase